MSKIKLKKKWRNSKWILKTSWKVSLSVEELEVIRDYWFHRWNFDTGHKNDLKAFEKIDARLIIVPPRALKAKWTMEMAETWTVRFGIDVEEELSKILSDEIKKEEMLDSL